MKKLILLLMVSLLLACSEESTDSTQSNDFELLGPVNPDGAADITNVASSSENIIFYLNREPELFKSDDNGLNWAEIQLPNGYSEVLVGYNGKIYYGAKNGFYYSGENQIDWKFEEIEVTDFPTSDIEFGMNGEQFVLMSYGFKSLLYYREDQSSSWARIATPNDSVLINDMAFDKSNELLIITKEGNLYISKNNYSGWERIKSEIDHATGVGGIKLCASDNYIFIATGLNLERYDYNGNLVTVNYLHASTVKEIVSLGDKIFAATEEGLYNSKDEGDNWTFVNEQDRIYEHIILTEDNYLFISNLSKLYRSENIVD